MFTVDTPKNEKLDEAIDSLYSDMASTDGGFSEEYQKCVAQLIQLEGLRKAKSPQRPSPDVMATVIGNLLGILIIVKHERANIITSKALGFVLKMR